jgi:hypothetical protein
VPPARSGAGSRPAASPWAGWGRSWRGRISRIQGPVDPGGGIGIPGQPEPKPRPSGPSKADPEGGWDEGRVLIDCRFAPGSPGLPYSKGDL